MSNGNNPNEPDMKKIEIVLTAEGYAVSKKEWLVPEELLRPYAIAYDAAISKIGLEISKAIYEEIIGGAEFGELALGMPIIKAND
jgi:hypothetical protein